MGSEVQLYLWWCSHTTSRRVLQTGVWTPLLVVREGFPTLLNPVAYKRCGDVATTNRLHRTAHWTTKTRMCIVYCQGFPLHRRNKARQIISWPDADDHSHICRWLLGGFGESLWSLILRFIFPCKSECQPIFQNKFQIFWIKFLFLVQIFQKHIALVYFLKTDWCYMFLKA